MLRPVLTIGPKGSPGLRHRDLRRARPGGRIIEEEIAARYKVSRSPVRDALRRLEADGLLVREDHGARG